jgi:hypothetical protein
LHVDLHEGAGQLLRFPRSAGFAGTQANDDVLHPDCLPRLQRQVPDNAVALVEQANHRDPLRHRRHARLFGGGARNLDGDGIAFGRLVIALAAPGKRGHRDQARRKLLHCYSGVQAL